MGETCMITRRPNGGMKVLDAGLEDVAGGVGAAFAGERCVSVEAAACSKRNGRFVPAGDAVLLERAGSVNGRGSKTGGACAEFALLPLPATRVWDSLGRLCLVFFCVFLRRLVADVFLRLVLSAEAEEVA